MSKKKSFAIFGLGRYGRAIAEELVAHGADVIAVDKDEDIVDEASLGLPVCKCADITDSAVIEQLGCCGYRYCKFLRCKYYGYFIM